VYRYVCSLNLAEERSNEKSGDKAARPSRESTAQSGTASDRQRGSEVRWSHCFRIKVFVPAVEL